MGIEKILTDTFEKLYRMRVFRQTIRYHFSPLLAEVHFEN